MRESLQIWLTAAARKLSLSWKRASGVPESSRTSRISSFAFVNRAIRAGIAGAVLEPMVLISLRGKSPNTYISVLQSRD